MLKPAYREYKLLIYKTDIYSYLSGLIPRNRLRWRAKLLRIFDRFLGLRDFGEICIKVRAFFVSKTHNF